MVQNACGSGKAKLNPDVLSSSMPIFKTTGLKKRTLSVMLNIAHPLNLHAAASVGDKRHSDGAGENRCRGMGFNISRSIALFRACGCLCASIQRSAICCLVCGAVVLTPFAPLGASMKVPYQ
jgi:hypothetical protein